MGRESKAKLERRMERKEKEKKKVGDFLIKNTGLRIFLKKNYILLIPFVIAICGIAVDVLTLLGFLPLIVNLRSHIYLPFGFIPSIISCLVAGAVLMFRGKLTLAGVFIVCVLVIEFGLFVLIGKV